jgi:ketosteroid isomerase-like protein
MAKDSSFDQLMKTRGAVATAYVNGDVQPLRQLLTRSAPSSFFGPQSGPVCGAEEVRDAYERGAQPFGQGSETQLEVLHQQASGDLGYWVGIQRAVVRLRGEPRPVKMALRVTEIFRRIDGDWRLIHRHADPLAEPWPGKTPPLADGGDGGSAIRANESASASAGPPFVESR